jgi:hypothetical protein
MIPLFFPSVLKIPAQEDDLSYHPAAPGAIHNHPNAEWGMGNAEFLSEEANSQGKNCKNC